MVSDSPYRTREPVLTPAWGIVAGLAGSLLMLLVIVLLRPISGLSAQDLLIRAGQVVIPRGPAFQSHPHLLAGGLYASIGAMLGLLYAVSQERIPVRGLVAVGIFFGFVIWAVSRVLASLFFEPILRSALRSSAWFVACVLYGVFLAGCAVWSNSRRPKSSAAIPID